MIVVYYLIRDDKDTAIAIGELVLKEMSNTTGLHGFINVPWRQWPELISESQYQSYRAFGALPEYINPEESDENWIWCPTCEELDLYTSAFRRDVMGH